MKRYSLIPVLCLILSVGCADPDLDPIQFKNAKPGALIALRGGAYENLNDASFLGAVDKFSISNPAGQTFEFDAEYISKTVDNLSKIEVYARFKQEARVKVATIEGRTFTIPAGKRYPNGKISIPLATILTALGKSASDFEVGDVIRIQSDLVLTDGSTILASSVVNSSLSEAAFFFPAHNLLYLAVQ